MFGELMGNGPLVYVTFEQIVFLVEELTQDKSHFLM